MNDDDLYSHVYEPIVIVRKRFLLICDNDMCAAMLLDRFYARQATDIEYEQFGDRFDADVHRKAGHTRTTIEHLGGNLLDMFEPEQVTESLVYLQDKGYIEAFVIDDDEELDLICRELDITCSAENIKKACAPYIKPSPYDSANVPETPRIDVPVAIKSPEEIRFNLIANEEYKVAQNNKRAIKARLTASLTVEEWIATLDHFNWKCAYCQDKPYKVLEHFLPIVHGGGTTNLNCVPACHGCNGSKSSWNPLATYGPDFSHMKEGLDRVKNYFDNLSLSTPIAIETDVVQN